MQAQSHPSRLETYSDAAILDRLFSFRRAYLYITISCGMEFLLAEEFMYQLTNQGKESNGYCHTSFLFCSAFVHYGPFSCQNFFSVLLSHLRLLFIEVEIPVQ